MVALSDILDFMGPDVQGFSGPRNMDVSRAAALDDCKTGCITFAKSSAALHLPILPSAIIIPTNSLAELANVAVIRVDNPRLAFLRVVAKFFSPRLQRPGIHPSAVVEEGADIHDTASIGANCFIAADVTVGAGSVILPNATVMHRTRIGANVRVGSGVVIGGEGYGYERNQEGVLEAFPHIGGVVIEDDVDVGANTCIDRGTLGNTVIGRGTKIDNLVHVAHNVKIGENVALIANSLIGGSVTIGDGAWISPSVTVLNQIKIGKSSFVGIGAMVNKDVADGVVVMGSPAMPQEQFRKLNAAVKSLLK